MATAQDWGPSDNGLQMRILPVNPAMDEQSPQFDIDQRQTEFNVPREVTLVAEIRNSSESPVSLRGVRYKDNVSGGFAGKSATASLAHWLFKCELTDGEGNLFKGPSDALQVEHPALSPVSMSRLESIEPGDSILMLLYPLRWDSALESKIVAGEYRLRIQYNGGETCQLAADSEMISLLSPTEDEIPSLNWGDPVGSLRVAARYRMADSRIENPAEYAATTFPIESRVSVNFHIQNISNAAIELESEVWRQDDMTYLVTSEGEQMLSGTWYSGITPRKTWVLEPKEVVVIPAPPIGFSVDADEAVFDHPTGSVVEGAPGIYRMVHELRIADQQIRTGTTDLTIRERNDNDAVPTLTFQLRFDRPDGTYADDGYIRVKHRGKEEVLFEGRINSTITNVDGCTGEDLSVEFRIPGAVAGTSVVQNPGNERANVVELENSIPATLRLIDENGTPVEGVNVRYFNHSFENAGSDPYPVQGLEGPVYGSSDNAGNVRIDFLEHHTAGEADQPGDKVYWFYVEPIGNLASKFIGPIKAGDDAGDVLLSNFVEIKGEIHGTPEQLQNLAAHWDQEFEMLRGDDESSWAYARSERLSFSIEGDKAVFRLTNLRPGKLRIVGTFAPRPHTYSFNNARRTAGSADWEFEIELTESSDDIVIRPEG
ncbi:MAG: hypothetical protein AAF456_10040 [Planctomycetota bacterium]